MIVVTDFNVLFSALTNKKSTSYKILISNKGQFIAPDYLYEEFTEKVRKIALLTGIKTFSVLENYKSITKNITFYDSTKINIKNIDNSELITNEIDYKDVMYVALHLQTKHKLWTGDKVLIKGLKAKGYDICITTSELKKKLKIK